jgi:hypothetical protein
MQLSTYQHAQGFKQAKRSLYETDNLQWWRDLPAKWSGLVVVLTRFDVAREYEIFADRTCGYDEDDAPCYCAYRYLQTALRADDDDIFYEELLYAESLTAWRLRDERWLIFRKIAGNDDCNSTHSLYSFSDSMPR